MKHEWKSVCSDVFFDTAPSTQHILHNIIKTASSIGSFRILSSAKTLVSELQPKTLVLIQGLSQWIYLGAELRRLLLELSVNIFFQDRVLKWQLQLKQYDRWDLCLGRRSWKSYTKRHYFIIYCCCGACSYFHVVDCFMSHEFKPMVWFLRRLAGSLGDGNTHPMNCGKFFFNFLFGPTKVSVRFDCFHGAWQPFISASNHVNACLRVCCP